MNAFSQIVIDTTPIPSDEDIRTVCEILADLEVKPSTAGITLISIEHMLDRESPIANILGVLATLGVLTYHRYLVDYKEEKNAAAL